MIEHNGLKLCTLHEHPDYCPDCDVIGGYCGHCHGGFFGIKSSGYMLVTLQSCVYCDDDGKQRSYVISYDDYKQDIKDYKAQWHECTSTNSIFGGGACCSPIGHRVETLYIV